MSNIVLAAGGDDGYQISRSVRLRSSATAYFSKTPSAITDGKKWTWSAWVKRGALVAQGLFDGFLSTSAFTTLSFYNDTLFFYNYASAVEKANMATPAVFRDPSAWYHIVLVYDSANATSANRVIIYVNGVRQTLTTTTAVTLNDVTYINNTSASQRLGVRSDVPWYFDGYVAETNFIDGQALTPSSFGETDILTGVWKPKKYVGTYGTNGFYLNFSDNSAATAAAIGKDSSGNGNNWTPNNISVTAGATYDSMTDVPTLGPTSSNYCVWNPLTKGSSITISNGNLDALGSVNTNTGNTVLGSIGVTSGKWYAEFKVQNTYSFSYIGVADPANPGSYPGANSSGYAVEVGTGATYNVSAGPSVTGAVAGDTVMVALDMDNGKIWWGKNGTWGGTGNPLAGTGQQFSGLSGLKVFMLSAYAGSGTFNANFGQQPFSYTPPTGFKALNTQNLPDATIKAGNKYFDALTWTGNGTTRNITGLAFQPDLVWLKSRTNPAAGNFHHIRDSVRGAAAGALSSNTTEAENTYPQGGGVTAFNTDGFTLTNGSGGSPFNWGNENTYQYVGWQWKKGATQGFDIVTYTGTGANRTVAHSLGVAPSMIIVKRRDSGPSSWTVWHSSFSSIEYIYLNLSNAKSSSSGATVWNSTLPTSSVFSLGTYTDVNASGGTHVAYLFSEVPGFSKFGSYVGNASADGTFVHLGFRPRYIMIKASSAIADWDVFDTARDPSNATQQFLFPNLSSAEFTSARIDLLSNGFKLRATGDPNNSGVTYIYAAFAENPFKNSLAR